MKTVARFLVTRLAVISCAGVVLAAHQSPAPVASHQATPDGLIHDAFEAAYSLDHDESLALARKAVAMAPQSAAAHRTVAAMIFIDVLFIHGAVTADHYLGGASKSALTLPKPPPDLDAEFRRELAAAISLADAAVRKNPRDVQAVFDLGAADGLQASYAAAIDGKASAAFSAAKGAYDRHEQVLASRPDLVEAGLVVGTYRYLVSSLSLPLRLFAYIIGFGGGKERGISLIEAATTRGASQVDAKVALILIYNREHRYDDALRLLRGLEPQYPRNRVFVLEEGATLLRAGRAQEAEAVLSAGLDRLKQDERTRFPGEQAMWLYKRGCARIQLDHRAEASEDLNAAIQAGPVGWVLGRIHVELGKLGDLNGTRSQALGEYRQASTTCRTNNDTLCVAEAEQLLRQPFKVK